MPIIKNILRRGVAKFQGLDAIDVFREETASVGSDLAVSQFFNITSFPSKIPLGNSFFSLEGSDLLKPDVELKTEILDVNNFPIFHYAIKKPKTQRRVDVTIEVYPGVSTGVGKLVILGELNPDKVNVPQEFQGLYNVRFVGQIMIDAEIRNTEPIKFFGVPKLTVKESVRPNIIIPATEEVSFNTISGSGTFFGGDNSGLSSTDDADVGGGLNGEGGGAETDDDTFSDDIDDVKGGFDR
tara:strand:- start:2873 stop:3592 length:720 start_codon:yes stop_codon:yes gene_type:complete